MNHPRFGFRLGNFQVHSFIPYCASKKTRAMVLGGKEIAVYIGTISFGRKQWFSGSKTTERDSTPKSAKQATQSQMIRITLPSANMKPMGSLLKQHSLPGPNVGFYGNVDRVRSTLKQQPISFPPISGLRWWFGGKGWFPICPFQIQIQTTKRGWLLEITSQHGKPSFSEAKGYRRRMCSRSGPEKREESARKICQNGDLDPQNCGLPSSFPYRLGKASLKKPASQHKGTLPAKQRDLLAHDICLFPRLGIRRPFCQRQARRMAVGQNQSDPILG